MSTRHDLIALIRKTQLMARELGLDASITLHAEKESPAEFADLERLHMYFCDYQDGTGSDCESFLVVPHDGGRLSAVSLIVRKNRRQVAAKAVAS